MCLDFALCRLVSKSPSFGFSEDVKKILFSQDILSLSAAICVYKRIHPLLYYRCICSGQFACQTTVLLA